MQIPFIGMMTEARELRVNAQKLVNLYPVVEGDAAKSRVALYSTPGLKPYKSIGLGPCRSNGVVFWNKAYFVSGAELIQISDNDTAVVVGTLATNYGRVIMDVGRNVIGLTDGRYCYYYDGTTFGVVTDVDFPYLCDWIVNIRGFWIANQTSSDTFTVSDVDNITSWSALNFATAERKPDRTKAMMAIGNILLLVGESSIEAFRLTGNAAFPFEPELGFISNWGIHAPYSLAKGGESAFWLGQTDEGAYAVMEGSINAGFRKVSNQGIEDIIARLGTNFGVADAEGFCIYDKASLFYVLTFPLADATLVLDTATGVWHERKSPGIGRWRVGGYVFFNNKHIVGDYESGQFYTLDRDCYTDAGEAIERTLRTQHIFDPEGNRAIHHAYIQAEYAPGVGLTSGTGSDPVVRVRWSDDGGYKWSSFIHLKIGKEGERDRIVKTRRLGMAKMRCYEFHTAEPVPITVLNAYGIIK